MRFIKLFCVLFGIIFFTATICAQTKSKVEIIFAKNFEGIKSEYGKISKLIGNVNLKHNNTLMWCDSALLYDDDNLVEAYSNVKINYKDSVIITGEYLRYDGNSRYAIITGNVVLQDNSIILKTDNLEYDIPAGMAYYNTGAVITNADNKLTSKLGYYNTLKKDFFFRKDVILTNPEYVMQCDTLRYNTSFKTAFFLGKTNITGKTDKIYCENGWYDTRTDISQFSKNAVLTSDGIKIKADSLFYNKKIKLGKAYRNIILYDSVQKIYLYGNYGQTNGVSKISYVTQKPKALKLMEGKDSLWIWADTLLLADKTPKQKQLLKAVRNVKLLKTDIQAVCDSLIYNSSDSNLVMFKSPVLWSGLNQITSDTMLFYLKNNKLDSFTFLSGTFIASKEKGNHFNQVKGKDMAGRFDSSMIKHIHVYGNGQSIYYAKEDSINYIGVNVIDCSEMEFYFKQGRINKAVFINNADATLYPLDEKKPEDLRLKGFKWLEKFRPKAP